MKMTGLKRMIMLLLAALLCFTAALPVFSTVADGEQTDTGESFTDEEGNEYRYVGASLSIKSTGTILDYTTFYSDDVFFYPSTQYRHMLARMSLFLALSAFRNGSRRRGGEIRADQYLVDYLFDCGFEDVRTDDYEKVPSLYTVATAIGHKEIERDGEKCTLVAVGVCGGLYQKEWMSNMTVGAMSRHTGFDSAARIVTDRILGYIAGLKERDHIKIWISGFSRAAAIANLTAANLDDSDVFDIDDIYAYTFATPRNTSWGGSEGYENIFNIIGPADAVPQVAPLEWGYERYGTDLYLPGSEYRSDFDTAYAGVKDLMKKIGIDTYYNADVNLRLRLMLGMLLELVPDNDAYLRILQPTLVSVIDDRSINNILKTTRGVTLGLGTDAKTDRMHIDALFNYIAAFVPEGVFKTGAFKDRIVSGPLVVRFAHEHLPELYLSWMGASENIDRLYQIEPKTVYAFLEGDASYTVRDGASGKDLFFISESGALTAARAGETRSIPVSRSHGIMTVVLPCDADYALVCSRSDGDVRARCMACDPAPQMSYTVSERTLNAAEGEVPILRIQNGALVAEGMTETELLSSELAALLGVESTGVDWHVMITAAIFVLCVLLAAIAMIPLALRAVITKEPFPWLALVCGMLIVCGLLEGEAAYWLMAHLEWVIAAWSAVTGIGLIGFAYAVDHGRIALEKLLILALAIVGDVLFAFWENVGIALVLGAHGIAIVFALLRHPVSTGRWIAFMCLSALGIVATLLWSTPMLRTYLFAAYIPIMLLMLITSSAETRRRRHAMLLLVIADLLFAIDAAYPDYAILHMLHRAAFIVSLSMFAASNADEQPATAEAPAAEQMPAA